MIIIVEKYNSNNNPKFIDYQTFQKELETTISIISKKNNIKTVDGISKFIENFEICE